MALGLSLLLTGIIIPQILVIAFRKKLFDTHDSRKIHEGTVPRLGGISFVPSIIFSVLCVIGLLIKGGSEQMITALMPDLVPLMMLICALMLLFIVGIGDDMIGVRYSLKFLLQIISAALVIAGGVWLSDFNGVLWLHEVPAWLGMSVTLLLVVYIVNSINLIDGIDGLAAGLAEVALFFYGAVFFFECSNIYSMVAWAAFGTLISFLYFNMFGNVKRRKKIFMGDTGSLTIGMMIAFFALAIAGKAPAEDSFLKGTNPIVMAYSPLIIPLLDVLRVFLHRIRHKKNPFMPDRSHIHHKLLAIGFSARTALATILLADLAFLVSNVVLSKWVDVNLLLLGDIVIWTLLNIWISRKIVKREAKLGKKLCF